MGLGELVLLLCVVLAIVVGIGRMASHRGTSRLRVVAAGVGGLCLAAVVWYGLVLGPEARASVAASTLGTPLGRAVPWLDRADPATRQALAASSDDIATNIQRITHPTGESASLSDFVVRRLSDSITVRIDVDWKGGFLGSRNRTTVVWEFAQTGHIRTALLDDTGAFGVGESNRQQLDEYFRSELYPAIRARVGD